jgi:peroxiredoxin
MRSLRYLFTIVTSVFVGAGALIAAMGMMMMISTTVRSASTNDIVVSGAAAPEIALQNIDNKTFKLSDLRGKPAVLFFWADWHPDCQRLMPEFNQMFQDGVSVVGINLMEPRDRVLKAISRDEIQFPVLMDSDGETGRAYGVEEVPNVFVIDAKGRLVHHGFATPATIPQVQNLLHSIAR